MTTTSHHKTAKTRSKLSAPAKWIVDNCPSFEEGETLDYGCGKGLDASRYGWQAYDPNHPDEEFRLPIDKNFDTILCTYVLNVIPSQADRDSIIQDIRSHLTKDGVAYVTVRNDKSNLNGYTSKGTWQGLIELDYPIVHSNSSYIIYKVTK